MADIFDVDEVLASLEPPRFKHGGREIVGRFLSLPDWHRAAQLYRALATRGMSAEEWRTELRWLLDIVFPPDPAPATQPVPSWHRRIARWLPRWFAPAVPPVPPPSVADIVLALPNRRQLEAFALFFASLAREQNIPTRPEPGPAMTTEMSTPDAGLSVT